MKLISYKVWDNPNADWFDKLVGIVTIGNFSHNELVFDNGDCFSISARDSGGRFKKINIKSESWDVIELPNIIDAKVRLEAKKLVGVKYDHIGAITSPFRLCLHLRDKIYCSEVCGNLLRNNGLKLEKGCKYTPKRLRNEIKKITEGMK